MKPILANKNIVVTRSEEQSSGLIEMLSSAGANVISIPTIKIVPVNDHSEFDRLISDLLEIDFIIFTSANTVKYFFQRIEKLNILLNLTGKQIAVVGESTLKSCGEKKICVNITPDHFSAKGLLAKFESMNIKNKNVLIPCSTIARTELKDGLTKLSANVFSVPVYDVVLPDETEVIAYQRKLKNFFPDVFVFTSPSTFNNFLKMFKVNNPVEYFSHSEIAAIGPTTADAIESTGAVVTIKPEKYTVENLFKKIIERFSIKV
ncbi:MAG: uroporphyrinogen-III synthase [bacterium]